MRCTLIVALALMTACARTEQYAVETPERDVTVEDFVGFWEGTVKPEGSDVTVATIELMATQLVDGWSFTVVSPVNPALSTTSPARVVAVGGDSVVVEAGPFPSVLRPGEQVSTHSIYRLRGERLVGLVRATYSSGEEVTLNTEAERRR